MIDRNLMLTLARESLVHLEGTPLCTCVTLKVYSLYPHLKFTQGPIITVKFWLLIGNESFVLDLERLDLKFQVGIAFADL